MSRPFSYNDENFTVIGNILFCHIMVTKYMEAGSDFIEIPPDIYKRMFNKSNYLKSLTIVDNNSSTSIIPVGTAKETDGKYYIYVREALDAIGKCLIGYYILKDI